MCSKPVQILYVEDDLGAATLFRKKMNRLGYQVDLAYDGEQGLTKWNDGAYDVLAVDQDMPRLKGLELIRMLADQGALPPTVMVTGAGNETIAVEAMKLGADDYIIKDPEARYLQLIPSVVEQALEKRRILQAKSQADEKLRDSESRFRLLVESAPEAIFVQVRSCFAYLNQAGVKLFGANTAEDLLGSPVLERLHPSFHDLGRERIRALNVDKTKTPAMDMVWIRMDGTLAHFEVSGVPINYQGEDGALVFARDISERKLIENVQSFLIECGWASGEDFFRSLSRFLAESLRMDFVCISRLSEDCLSAHPVAAFHDGDFEVLEASSLNGTPCGAVIEKAVCCFPKQVRQLFPEHLLLQEMRAESYAGIILMNSQGLPIGLISAIGRQTIQHPGIAESILKAASVRAAGELERRDAEEALKRSDKELRLRNKILDIFASIPDEQAYAEILSFVIETLGSQYGTFGYFDGFDHFVVPAMTREIFWEQCRIPEKDIIFQRGAFHGLWARCLEERKTLYSNDYQFLTPPGHIPIVNTMVAPVVFRDDVIATIHVANKQTGYNEQDRESLDMITSHIAPVLKARLERDRREKERESAQRVALRKEAELDVILNAVPTCIAFKDCSNRIVGANRPWIELFGARHDELLGKSLEDFLPADQAMQAYRDDLEVINSGLPRTGIVEEMEIGAQPRWFLTDKIPYQDDNGNTVGVICFAQDITERKRMENALRDSEEKFATIFGSAPVLMSLVKVDDGTYAEVNDRFTEVSGFSRVEALGRTPEELGCISYEDRQRLSAELRAHGRVRGMELTLITKDKRELRCICYEELIQLREGQLILSMATDVTDLKETESKPGSL